MRFEKSPFFGIRNGNSITAIVIHTCVGTYEGTISYFKANVDKVSAHYVISLSGEVCQMVEEKYAAFHAGNISKPTFKQTIEREHINPNFYSIGIEAADDKNPSGANREKQYPALIQLVADICKRYDIPCDENHICGHRSIRSTKTCPGNIDVSYIIKEAKKMIDSKSQSDVPEVLQKYGKGSLSDLVRYIDQVREEVEEQREQKKRAQAAYETTNSVCNSYVDMFENAVKERKDFENRIFALLPDEYEKSEGGLIKRLSKTGELEDTVLDLQTEVEQTNKIYRKSLSEKDAELSILESKYVDGIEEIKRLRSEINVLKSIQTKKPFDIASLLDGVVKLFKRKV